MILNLVNLTLPDPSYKVVDIDLLDTDLPMRSRDLHMQSSGLMIPNSQYHLINPLKTHHHLLTGKMIKVQCLTAGTIKLVVMIFLATRGRWKQSVRC